MITSGNGNRTPSLSPSSSVGYASPSPPSSPASSADLEAMVGTTEDTTTAASHKTLAQSPLSKIHATDSPYPILDGPTHLFHPQHVAFLNASLAHLSPLEIVKWALLTIPNCIQTTAFGVTGIVITDLISRAARELNLSSHPVPLVFIDTLYRKHTHI